MPLHYAQMNERGLLRQPVPRETQTLVVDHSEEYRARKKALFMDAHVEKFID